MLICLQRLDCPSADSNWVCDNDKAVFPNERSPLSAQISTFCIISLPLRLSRLASYVYSAERQVYFYSHMLCCTLVLTTDLYVNLLTIMVYFSMWKVLGAVAVILLVFLVTMTFYQLPRSQETVIKLVQELESQQPR